MIGKKCAKGSTRKFILVETKQEFDKLSIQSYQPIQPQKQKPSQQQIIIPKISIQKECRQARAQKIPRSYIKTITLPQSMNRQSYELDQLDHNFLHHKLPFLSLTRFAQIIVALEKAANRESGTQFNFRAVLNRQFKNMGFPTPIKQSMSKENNITQYTNDLEDASNLTKINMRQIYRDIFVFWRNKRKNIKSPLLRSFWIKNQVGPYKQRQEYQTLQLRNRTIRVEDDVIRQILKQDIQNLKKILLQMRKRQEMELKLLENQQIEFEKQCSIVLEIMHKNSSSSQQAINSDSSQTFSIGGFKKEREISKRMQEKTRTKEMPNKRSPAKSRTKKKARKSKKQ